jgi:hypothetical protein
MVRLPYTTAASALRFGSVGLGLRPTTADPLAPIDGLLHSHAFGEVAGFVHVAAAEDGDVIGQQLQR